MRPTIPYNGNRRKFATCIEDSFPCRSYVYCDVLEHVSVGDTKAPFLRIVQVSGECGDRVQAIYDKPIYVPLQKNNFDSIEIDIRNDAGKPISFEYGKLIVTLHFRLSKIPYLLR